MSDNRGHNRSAVPERLSHKKGGGVSLTQWIYQNVGVNQGRVSSRLRGNNLHILIESPICPNPSTLVPKLSQALAAVPLSRLLPPDAPPIYRVIVYGRQSEQAKPAWTQSFYPNQLTRARQRTDAAGRQVALENTPVMPGSAGGLVPLVDLARLGQPEAIARYLSSTFSEMGVAVRARVEVIGKVEKVEGSEESPLPEPPLSKVGSSRSKIPSLKRLYVICESAYSPDLLVLSEPISQRLRQLELQGFSDAVVFGQVRGEPKPEWLLRVDLTPTDEILREWARWGDGPAIARWLNRRLALEEMQVSALIKDATLHLSCEHIRSTVPDQRTAIRVITAALESLSPQGIQAATVYGLSRESPGNSALPFSPSALATPAAASPHWVHWLNLPASQQPELAKTTLELAQAAHLDAISFLLTRLLNPDLERMLATGGTRIQIRQKQDLLHIMADAPTCPNQSQVGSAISRFLKPLAIPGVAGVRIYGRRAGQKQPLWSYGVDFISRNRLVPEAAPEFAASDIYVNDLLEPPGALVLRSDRSADAPSVLARWLETAIQTVQRSLIQTQLFLPLEPAGTSTELVTTLPPGADPGDYRGIKVALVWGTVGLLMVIQADWLLGQLIRPAPPKPVSPPPAVSSSPAPSPKPVPLPQISLSKTPTADPDAFNPGGFTQPGTVLTVPSPSQEGSPDGVDSPPLRPVELPASPLQPKANLPASRFPSFNSRQLDEKIALYQAYVTQHGVPDVLVIGSSRALRGVDPVALQKHLAAQGYPGIKVFNFGINGATAQVVDLILHQIVPQEKMPRLILFADGARAFNSGRLDITYNGIVASEGYRMLIAGRFPLPGTTLAQATSKPPAQGQSESVTGMGEGTGVPVNGYQAVNRVLDQRLGALSQLYSQRDRLKALLSQQVASLLPGQHSWIALGKKVSPNELSDATSPAASASNSPPSVLNDGGTVDVDGFLPLPNRFNPVTYYQKYARVSGDYDSDYEAFNLEGRQTDAVVAIAQFARTQHIPFVFVNLPLTHDYLDPIRKRHEEAFQQHMLQLSTQLGFTYRDLSTALTSQPDYFSDPSHLNRYGAYEVSRRLAEDVMIPWQQARK
ncbi:hypothetical protein J5X98_09490 [Leptothermofonsia sichuanensis E412]|uniref:hypothetical protein n=1 Tax=Leptothermofonsia sichuanensis TaxID=2917832 RepID=UPI001CA6A983|nr:hypothetical protein [Leptothermofonsia sichuanensis]QZZ22567.1 hypothetical protein J5X98_09490 [Leptothermofonsia sichuanensis E412]